MVIFKSARIAINQVLLLLYKHRNACTHIRHLCAVCNVQADEMPTDPAERPDSPESCLSEKMDLEVVAFLDPVSPSGFKCNLSPVDRNVEPDASGFSQPETGPSTNFKYVHVFLLSLLSVSLSSFNLSLLNMLAHVLDVKLSITSWMNIYARVLARSFDLLLFLFFRPVDYLFRFLCHLSDVRALKKNTHNLLSTAVQYHRSRVTSRTYAHM